MYLATVLAGFTKLDAITLKLADLLEDGPVFKAGLAMALRRTYGRVALVTIVVASAACVSTAWLVSPLSWSLR